MGERIAQIEEIVKSVLRELPRGYPGLLALLIFSDFSWGALLNTDLKLGNMKFTHTYSLLFSYLLVCLFTCLFIAIQF